MKIFELLLSVLLTAAAASTEDDKEGKEIFSTKVISQTIKIADPEGFLPLKQHDELYKSIKLSQNSLSKLHVNDRVDLPFRNGRMMFVEEKNYFPNNMHVIYGYEPVEKSYSKEPSISRFNKKSKKIVKKVIRKIRRGTHKIRRKTHLKKTSSRQPTVENLIKNLLIIRQFPFFW